MKPWETGPKSWEDEQHEYLLSKEASHEMAAICFGAMAIMIVVGLLLEVFQRLFG